jgi:hypothetical protein
LVSQLHRGRFEEVRSARTIGRESVAVQVDLGLGKPDGFRQRWQRPLPDRALVVLELPDRTLIDPVLAFVRNFESNPARIANTCAPWCNRCL